MLCRLLTTVSDAMDLANLPLFSAITRKMSWLTSRQRVLAENVANVDTPQYKAADLRPLDFRNELAQLQGKLQPKATDPNHLSGTIPASSAEEQTVAEPVERDINGNTVSIEDEMMKVSDTMADYQLMTSLYKKQIGMLKQALGRGGASG
jgi:flagellar basal-body rod protein FlgB